MNPGFLQVLGTHVGVWAVVVPIVSLAAVQSRLGADPQLTGRFTTARRS